MRIRNEAKDPRRREPSRGDRGLNRAAGRATAGRASDVGRRSGDGWRARGDGGDGEQWTFGRCGPVPARWSTCHRAVRNLASNGAAF